MTATATINYPTWKIQGEPTPNETLYVCDKCGTATWGPAAIGPVNCHCTGRKGGFVRMRKATAAETAEGKRHLKQIIGLRSPPAAPPASPPARQPAKPLPPGVKPQYILRFIGGPYDGLYYSRAKAWQGVNRDEAEGLTHKDALRVQGHVKRLGLASALEPKGSV